MEIAERGRRRTGQGVLWSLLVLLGLFEIWLGVVFGMWFFDLLGVATALACGVKAYGAFTGVRRFGKPA